MKIFSVALWDWAGCGYFLSEAINAHTEHHSRAYRKEDSRLEFPTDLTNLTGQRLKRLWNWADVIHIHDFPGFDTDTLPPKPVVQTFHGSKFRNAHNALSKIARDNGWMLSVATPDLCRPTITHVDGPPWLPDCRPDLSQYVDRADHFLAVYAPTKSPKSDHADIIARACRKVGVDFDLIMDVKWEECLRRKGRAWVTIDQMIWGYGCNAIEAWAMGQPVLSGGDIHVLRSVKEQCGGTLPFYYIEPDVDVIAGALVRMRDNPKTYQDYVKAGRAHYEKFHAPSAIADRAVKFYIAAQEIFARQEKWRNRNRTFKLVIPPVVSGLTLMRYIGTVGSRQTWFGDATKRRYEFRDGSIQYIFDEDVPGFLSKRDKRDRALFEKVEADASDHQA